ncbi:MAG TPA: hypothetical protein DCZ95_07510 [Verrucomicrobia bacterium]|nr:MAG: hypothetical protein A2X46_16395 [Lentisphaerae bacterium GWF2_57_35]HBA83922.1 hypothetical protein [Verrucomicrobiota bacterium]
MTTTEEKILLAKYAGTISRWCDLTGNVPDASGAVIKTAAELAAFVKHLERLAAEKRTLPPWKF